jgi:hypothetical protein
MNITINTVKDIEMMGLYNSWLSRPCVRNISITPNKISEAACHHYEKRIKSLFNDCGCIWASPIFIVAFFLVSEKLEVKAIALWKELAISFLIAVSAAFITKLTALGWSYYRLNITLAELKNSIGK